jgi:hypothetical protein
MIYNEETQDILNADLVMSYSWVVARALEYGYDVDELDVAYTDNAEDDHIMILEALNDKCQHKAGYKKLCFPL